MSAETRIRRMADSLDYLLHRERSSCSGKAMPHQAVEAEQVSAQAGGGLTID